jgi:hypothetical protein
MRLRDESLKRNETLELGLRIIRERVSHIYNLLERPEEIPEDAFAIVCIELDSYWRPVVESLVAGNEELERELAEDTAGLNEGYCFGFVVQEVVENLLRGRTEMQSFLVTKPAPNEFKVLLLSSEVSLAVHIKKPYIVH